MYATTALVLEGRFYALTELLKKNVSKFSGHSIAGAAFLVKVEVEGEAQDTYKLTPFGYKWVAKARLSTIEFALMDELHYGLNPDILLTDSGSKKFRDQYKNYLHWGVDIRRRVEFLNPDAILASVELYG